MPFLKSGGYKPAPKEIKMPGSAEQYDYRRSLWFDTSVVSPEDGSEFVYLDAGLILAIAEVADESAYSGVAPKYVPYEPGGSYGTGSDTPVGILDIRLDATLEAEAVAALYHGSVREHNCYVFGGDLGDISATIKTALPDINWI